MSTRKLRRLGWLAFGRMGIPLTAIFLKLGGLPVRFDPRRKALVSQVWQV